MDSVPEGKGKLGKTAVQKKEIPTIRRLKWLNRSAEKRKG